MEDLHLEVEAPYERGVAVVRVRGFVDTANASQLEASLLQQVSARRTCVVLDLSHVDYVSSAGWGVLVSAVRALQDVGGDLCLAAMQREVRQVYRLLEFPAILRAYDTVEEARAAAAN